MSGDSAKEADDLDEVDSGDEEKTFIDDSDDDVDIDMSAELKVDDLVARVEKENLTEIERKKQVRRRLEEIEERRSSSRDLDSTYNFNLDDDI